MNHRTGWRLGYRSLLHVEFFDVFPKLGIESVSIILLAWQISGRIAGKVEEWRRGVINGKFLFTWPSSDKRNLLPLWGISFHPSLNSSLAKEFLFDDFIIGFVVQRFARHVILDRLCPLCRLYYLPGFTSNDDSTTRDKNLHKLKKYYKNICSSVRNGFSFCSITEVSMRS